MVAGAAARGFARAAGVSIAIAIAGCTAATSGANDADAGDEESGGHAAPFGISIVPPAARICPGDCIELNAQAGGGRAPYTYRWQGGPSSDASTLTACPATTTRYTVAVDDTSGKAAMGHATVTVDPDCHGSPVQSDQGNPPGDASVFTGNACVDPPTDPWTGCIEIVFGNDPSPGAEPTLCQQGTTAPDAVSLCLPKAILEGAQYDLRVTYDVTDATGPLPLSGVAASRGMCDEDQWIILPTPWPPNSTPFTGTFVQEGCFTASDDDRQLLYEMIQQPFGGLGGVTVTFDLCNGCGPHI